MDRVHSIIEIDFYIDGQYWKGDRIMYIKSTTNEQVTAIFLTVPWALTSQMIRIRGSSQGAEEALGGTHEYTLAATIMESPIQNSQTPPFQHCLIASCRMPNVQCHVNMAWNRWLETWDVAIIYTGGGGGGGGGDLCHCSMNVSWLHDIVPSKIKSNFNCRCQLTCDDWGIPNTKLKYCQCASAALLCCKNTQLFHCIRHMITHDWWIWIVLFIPHCYKSSFSSGGCFCAFQMLVDLATKEQSGGRCIHREFAKLHWVKLIAVYYQQFWVRLRIEVMLIFTIHCPTIWLANAGLSRQFSLGTDWNIRHPSCCHFEWSLPSRLMVQYCVCVFCWIILHFLSFFEGTMPRNLQQQIQVRMVRLSAECSFQREVARILGVSQGYVCKVLRRNRDTGRPHQRRRKGRRSLTIAREDRQLIWMVKDNRFISTSLLVCAWRWSARAL